LNTSRLIVTQRLPVDAPEALTTALAVLRAGGLVVLPTDTVYGVACDPWNVQAVARLYAAKVRPRELAIPVLVASPQDVALVAGDLPAGFADGVARFWPGALTIIVPRRPDLPDIVTAGQQTVAVRMPAHPQTLTLLRLAGGVLAVTSANRSGEPASATADDAYEELSGKVDLLLDGGLCPGGAASAIVDLTAMPPRLVRPGPLSAAELRAVWPGLLE